jgi:transposase-like protein
MRGSAFSIPGCVQVRGPTPGDQVEDITRAQMKRHSPVEVSQMLGQAAEMMKGGMSQKDVCRALGVSVMTFHRWRKRLPEALSSPAQEHSVDLLGRPEGSGRTEDLRVENERLRRIVSDLLLEKMKVQEELEKARK